MTTRRNTYSAIDSDPKNPEQKEELNNATPAGKADIHGVASQETKNRDVPSLIIAPNEKVVKKGNASIRLGKDRPADLYSGAGGRGNSHCAAVDIVAGHQGFIAADRGPSGKKLYVHPDFKMDAARIYVSQNSNIDDYLGIRRQNLKGLTSSAAMRSTVALKADVIRIVARENIRLVTRTDDINSAGGELSNADKSGYGIDLIACNDPKDLQPLVKGDSLVECLEAILEVIQSVGLILDNFMEYQNKFNRTVQNHTHMSPFYGTETAVDFKNLLLAGVEMAINSTLNCQVPMIKDLPFQSTAVVNDYLASSGAPGDRYILSLYNRTN